MLGMIRELNSSLYTVYTIGWYMSKKLLHGWLLLLLIIGVVAELFVTCQTGPEELALLLKNCRQNGYQTAFICAAVLTVLAGSVEIPREIETGTIMLILTKPLKKRDVIVGKFVGLLLIAGAVYCSLSLLGVIVTTVRGLNFQALYLLPGVLLLLKLVICCAVTIFFSAALSEIPTIFFSVMYLLLGTFMDQVDYFLRFSPMDPLLTLCFRFVYYLIPNLAHLSPYALLEQSHATFQTMGFGFAYTMVYTMLFLFLATCHFSGREFAKA
jgi:ABC-type transport system involved in multi-copper enzyme maturation permease subunit